MRGLCLCRYGALPYPYRRALTSDSVAADFSGWRKPDRKPNSLIGRSVGPGCAHHVWGNSCRTAESGSSGPIEPPTAGGGAGPFLWQHFAPSVDTSTARGVPPKTLPVKLLKRRPTVTNPGAGRRVLIRIGRIGLTGIS